ncbi:RluA family pseudouridine synthase [Halobacillus yeomjeoni]|uniref:Pseudouridine synthase n=1 Tax=Halobacillus yeomjeoni TaxID=311194 RepID=A0A931HVD9_9BACI|nr:RluA family pseudouridine synthase [Halobacillus yeomjeoni]MBH0230377.1 RluA family pseudouridine synthase [Halobacillus yeomjeoni]
MPRKNNKKPQHLLVKETSQLLPFLIQSLPETGRNSVKSILKRGQVIVDDEVQTRHNLEVHPGQKIQIVKNKIAKRTSTLHGLEILHEDDHIIVIEKSSGLLSIASHKEKQLTAHRQLMNYVKSKNPNNRIYIVHRLDRDTSGVMMFAKSEDVKNTLQKAWKKVVKERTYVALVEGLVKKRQGSIESFLRESKTLKMISSQNPKGGQKAVTHYKVIQSNGKYTLLEVQLETGRKNQIRVHMEDIGHPIAGDKKYGANTNPLKRLGLHAQILTFVHPKSGKVLRFESPVPRSFYSNSK